MINLLPPEIKEELFLEKKKKLFIILGITLLIPLVCLVLILSSIDLYILGQATIQKSNLEDAKKQYQTPDFSTFKNTIEGDNHIISQLQMFYDRHFYTSDALTIISNLGFPKDVYLTNLVLTKNTDNTMNVVIAGVSGSRDDLLDFQKTLNANQTIENPSFSPDSWINPQNAVFNLTFKIARP